MMVFARASADIAKANPDIFQLPSIVSALAVVILVLSGELGMLTTTGLVLLSVLSRRAIRGLTAVHVVKHRVETFEERASDALTLQIPHSDSLMYFAYPDTSSAGRLLDLVDTSSAFKTRSGGAHVQWEGPPSSKLLAHNELSVFVTLDGSVPLDELKKKACLFTAFGNPEQLDASQSTDLRAELSVEPTPDGALQLSGRFGMDTAEPLDLRAGSGPQTYFLIRSKTAITVGSFDPYSPSVASSSARTQTTRKTPIGNANGMNCLVNMTDESIGSVLSVAIFGLAVEVEPNLRKAFARHVMQFNEVYRQTQKSLAEAEEREQLLRSTPRFKNVSQACSSVQDWTRFDPVMTSEACRSAIQASCTEDPHQVGCECWDPDFAQRDSDECSMQRSLYGTPQSKAPEQLSEDLNESPMPLEKQPHLARPPTLLEYLMPF